MTWEQYVTNTGHTGAVFVKKKKKPAKVKNGIAKDLRTAKYKMQVQKDRLRKNLERLIAMALREDHD